MAGNSFDVQSAVYSALVAAALTGVDRIVDGPIEDPGDADFPYVAIGEAQTITDDVSEKDGFQEFLTLHIWSRYRGQMQAKQIAGEIRDALHAESLTVAGLATCFAFVTSERFFDDPDGKTRHGVVTLNLYCRKG